MATTDYWIALARRDIGSARVLLAEGDTANCLFLCQQALEKVLKALLQDRSPEPPPRVHNLLRLAEMAGLTDDLPPSVVETLAEVDPYITEARYPAQAGLKMPVAPDVGLTERLLKQSEEAMAWFSARLK